jgi:hypothetical protein
MKPIECAVTSLALVVLTAGGCSCNNTPPPEIAATSAAITQSAPTPGKPPEIEAFDMKIVENDSLNKAALQATQSGHVDATVSNNQLVFTPDQNATHLPPSAFTIKTDTQKSTYIVLSPAAQALIKQRAALKQFGK